MSAGVSGYATRDPASPAGVCIHPDGFAQHAVAFGHWSFLRILWENDGITQRELSERAGLMEPTTFSALKAMEKLGYITRRQQPDSRKKVYVFLTPTGRALRDKLVPLAEEVNQIAVEGIDPAIIAAARDMLLTIIRNLARDEEQQSLKERRMPSTRQLSSLLERARKPARKSARVSAKNG